MHTKKLGKRLLKFIPEDGRNLCMYLELLNLEEVIKGEGLKFFCSLYRPFVYQRCFYEPSYSYKNVFPTYFKNSIHSSQL